uniref:Uncharacterized protein n=1 Tax=Amphimedon queenslandica TaxID=400682 RepID=A0A1X7T6K9_AMPQE
MARHRQRRSRLLVVGLATLQFAFAGRGPMIGQPI